MVALYMLWRSQVYRLIGFLVLGLLGGRLNRYKTDDEKNEETILICF